MRVFDKFRYFDLENSLQYLRPNYDFKHLKIEKIKRLCYISGMDFLNNYELQGESLKIFTIPAPVLKKMSEPVKEFNDEFQSTVKNMLYTMYKKPGIGLAAPQVGISKRFFVIDVDFTRENITNPDGSSHYDYSNFNPQVFINPEIVEKEGTILYEEGCLSIPGVFEEVKRAEKIKVKFQALNGETKEVEAAGTLAVCIQHELDHLNGIIFLDHLSLLKRQIIQKKFFKKRK